MKVLVLGKGKLGGEIVKQTGWDYLCRAEHEITIDNFDEWKNRMDGDDVVVNCIANTDTYSDNKEKHWKANYELVTFLAEYCDDNGKKLVHISTDYLYQNSVDDATEEDEPMFEHTWYFEPRTNKYNMKGLIVHDDCNKPIIGARTSLASGLNILSIMGCNPIVLIGCDCKMNGDKRYFWEYPGYHKPVRLDRRGIVPSSVKIAEGQKQCNDILEYWTLFNN
jgi:hypothetical protein